MDNLDSLIQLGTAGGFVAMIIGLTQLVKYANIINERFIPFVSMAFAFILSFMLIGSTHPVIEVVIVAILSGLTANGLYGAVKKTFVG